MNASKRSGDFTDSIDLEYAPAWRPKADEKIVMKIKGISVNNAGFGSYPILTGLTEVDVTIHDSDDRPIVCPAGSLVAVHAVHDVLRSQLKELRPKIGERIAIKYLGLVKGRGGERSYHGYRTAVDRPEAAFDWGTLDNAEMIHDDDDFIPSPNKDEEWN
jgi:hypothetical protein